MASRRTFRHFSLSLLAGALLSACSVNVSVEEAPTLVVENLSQFLLRHSYTTAAEMPEGTPVSLDFVLEPVVPASEGDGEDAPAAKPGVKHMINWVIEGTGAADEFEAVSGQVEVAEDDTAFSISLKARADAVVEADEAFTLRLSGERLKASDLDVLALTIKDQTTPAKLTVLPSFINFGTSLINTQTEIAVQLKNIGTAPANNARLSVDGTGFTLIDDQCGGVLQGGQSCAAKVRFSSATELNGAGALTGLSDETPDPVSSPMIGSAIHIQVELTDMPSARSNAIQLNGKVGGANVDFYRYKVGLSGAMNCSTAIGYSALIDSSIRLTDLLFADGTYRVCVVGASATGVAQPYSTATSYQWIKDTSRPTISISQSAGQTDPTKIVPIRFTLNISESILESTFTSEDIRFVGSAEVTSFDLTKLSSTSWQVVVNTVSGTGTVQVVVFEDAFMDLADNTSTASFPADNTVSFDNSGPQAATFLTWVEPERINQTQVHASWLPAVDDDLTQQEIQFFNDGACSSPIGSPVVMGKTDSTRSIVGNHNNTFTYRVRSLDGALNSNTSNCSSPITIDLVQPEVSSFSPAASVIPGTPANVIVTFNEAMDASSLVPARFTYTCNGAGNAQITGVSVLSATQARVNLAIVNEAANGEECTIAALVGSKDVAGNSSKAASAKYTYDLPAWILSVTSTTPNGTYKAGDVILIDVKFNEVVTLTGVGTPTLTLSSGDVPRNASYVSGSGTTDLRFSYTVQAGDNTDDLDYQSQSALALNGASLRDSYGSDSNLTLPTVGGVSSLAGAKALVLDTTPPGPFYINGISGGTDNYQDRFITDATQIRGDWTAGADAVTYQLKMFADDGVTELCSAPIGGGLNQTINPCATTDLLYYKARVEAFDAVGNGRFAEGGLYRFRALTGAVISTTTGQPTGLTNNPNISATVAGDNLGDYKYKIGPTGSTDCTNAVDYSAFIPIATPITADLTVHGNTQITLCVLGRNIALVEQALTDPTVAVWNQDLTKPTVTVDQRVGQADPINALPIRFTIVFSEPINPSSFSTSDITQSGTATGLTWSLSTSDNTTYTLSATAITGAGTVIPSIAAGAVSDPAGNTNFVSTATDNNVTYDLTKPGVTIAQKVGQGDPVNALPIEFTVTFSEAINGGTLTTSDVTQTGSASGLTWSLTNVNATTWTLAATSIGVAGTVIPSISAGKVTDVAGNLNNASTAADGSVLYDITPPAVANALKWSVASPTNNTTLTAQWTVSTSTDRASQSVRLYTGASCAVYSGTANAVGASIATTNFTGVNGTTYSFNVVTTDNAGNTSTSACSGSIVVDTTSPTVTNVTSAAANGSYRVGSIIDVRVTFSEVVAVVGGPTLALNTTPARSALFTSGSDSTTVVFNYTVQNGDNVADLNYVATNSLVATGGVTIKDKAGNNAVLTLPATGGAGSLGTNKNIEVDTVTPVINSFSVTTTSPSNQTNWAITGSITGTFTKYCILENNTSVSSCGWVNGTSLPANKTVAAPDGAKTLSLWIQDAAGNVSARAAANSVTLDTTPPTATLAGQPTGTSNKYSLNIDVAGTGVVEYRYKLGRSSTTTCSAAGGYSSAISAATNVIQDISNMTTYPNGGMRLCVVGRDAAGNWQPYASATGADWTKSFPSVTFAAGSSSVSEFGSPTHTMTVNLSRALNGSADVNVLVDYSMVGSGAYPAAVNTDFTTPTGTLTFSPGSTSKTVSLPVLDDTRQEYNETVTATLSNLRGALNGTTMAHVATISDDDPSPTIIMRDVSAIEGTSNIKMLATLSHPTDKATVSFNWAVGACSGSDCAANPTHYTISPSSGTVSFSPGEVSKSFPTAGADGVDSVNDGSDNLARRVVITGSSASNGTFGRSSASVLLADQDVPAGKAFIKISINRQHSCGIVGSAGSGKVLCWGSNLIGELGVGDVLERTVPTELTSGLSTTSVTDISAGVGHTCAVDNGAAKCWGADSLSGAGPGALGRGVSGNSSTPQQVSGLTSGVTAIAAGSAFSCALHSGAVKCWGDNRKGQLGMATSTTFSYSPVPIPAPMNGTVASVGAGQAHVCALKSGVVYCWGRDDFGELGRGAGNQTTHVPTALSIPGTVSHLWVGYSSNCAKNTSNHTYCWGFNGNGIIDSAVSGNVETPTRVSALDSATKIDFGQHICGLVGGIVKCRGSNLTGALGLNQPATTSTTTWQNVPMFSTASSAIDLSVSYEGHTCVVQTGGQVFCFGRDSYGQLGASAPVRRATRTLASDWSGSAYASQLFDGPLTTCGLVSGAVKCAGNNIYSMVGTIATDLINSFPVTVRSLTSGVSAIGGNGYANCALVSGAVKCWGLSGYVGNTGNMTNPTTVSGLSSGVTSLHTGPYTTCAIKSGKAYCWGLNSSGQMGNGSTSNLVSTPVEVAISGKTITDVSIGLNHICVLANGGIFCSGRNAEGLLGNGTTTASTVFVAVPGHESGYTALAASYYGQCALKSNADLYCWGNSRENGTSGSDVRVPTLVKSNILKVEGGRQTICMIENDTTATDADRLLCFGYFLNSEYPTGTSGCSASSMYCNIPTPHTEINALGKIVDLNVGHQRVCGRATASSTSWSCTGTDTNSSMGTGSTSVLFTPISTSPF